MHTHNRLLIVTGLLMASLPLGASVTLLGNIVREEANERLTVALEEAEQGYRNAVNLSAGEQSQKRIAERLKVRLLEVGKRKREVRLKIAELRQELGGVSKEAQTLEQQQALTRRAVLRTRDDLSAFIRQSYVRRFEPGSDLRRTIVRTLASAAGETSASALSDDALIRARRALMDKMLQSRETLALSRGRLHAAAGPQAQELASLEDEWETLTSDYRKIQLDLDRSEASLELTEQQLKQIRDITAEVQSEILRMQGELARIDTRLRTQAERKLIQMGLREDRPGWYTERPEDDPIGTFLWPVNGRISAGYLEESYRRFFGVPHKAIDIVVPQSTPVLSASEGIVFLARDGGLKGYSYILVGHRDGYATLYGHLSSFSVQAGQQVARGQVIGLSGGAPGSHGAGPMTTAPHLHFEVMRNGVHMDPRTMLP